MKTAGSVDTSEANHLAVPVVRLQEAVQVAPAEEVRVCFIFHVELAAWLLTGE
ncbi:hypothetical protein [Enterobacter kobei]|uniref:hypothetical protein n=1 Tax=Enterobacter kobei TaxID=208224 RepID=UPI00388E794A